MTHKRARFADLSMIIPDGWFDTTPDDDNEAPATLEKDNGLGALQFSRFSRSNGADKADLAELRELFEEMVEDYGDPVAMTETVGPVSVIKADFAPAHDFQRCWLVTNGWELVFITYTTSGPLTQQMRAELREAEQIVESIAFT